MTFKVGDLVCYDRQGTSSTRLRVAKLTRVDEYCVWGKWAYEEDYLKGKIPGFSLTVSTQEKTLRHYIPEIKYNPDQQGDTDDCI